MPFALDVLSPTSVFLLLMVAIAAFAVALEWSESGSRRRKIKDLRDHQRGLKTELKSLNAERLDLKNENNLLNQNVQYLYANIGLDNFQSDEQKKQFVEAIGAFARTGDVSPMLKLRNADLTQSLGMSSVELTDLMTFRNHLHEDWIKAPAKAAKSLDVLAQRLTAVTEMETVWRDKTSDVRDIRRVLAENMWVFEPDYVVSKGKLWVDRAISTIAGGAGQRNDEASGRRPDIVAVTALSASLQSGHQWRDIHRSAMLMIDLKGAGTRIDGSHKTQAWDYARELIQAGAVKPDTPIDCYVVGKEVDEDQGAPRIEGWAQNIRIIALSYEQLIARAKRLTLDLVRVLDATPALHDDKVHTMPEPPEGMEQAETAAPHEDHTQEDHAVDDHSAQDHGHENHDHDGDVNGVDTKGHDGHETDHQDAQHHDDGHVNDAEHAHVAAVHDHAIAIANNLSRASRMPPALRGERRRSLAAE
jgi:hypothetical protein